MEDKGAAYLTCGILMIASMLWAAASLMTHASIFIPEAIAIISFAVSWLVKGKTDVSLRGAIARFSHKETEPSNRTAT